MNLLFSSVEKFEYISQQEKINERLLNLPLDKNEQVLYTLPTNLYCIQQAYKKDLKLIGIILFCLWPVFFVGLFYIMISSDIALYLTICIGIAFAFCFSLYYFIYRWLWNRDIVNYENSIFIYTNRRLIVKGYNPHSRMPNSFYAYEYKDFKDIKAFEKQPYVALSFMAKKYNNLLQKECCTHHESFSVTVPVDAYKISILQQIEYAKAL